MKNVNGIWLPDHEKHLTQWAEHGVYGKWTYQSNKMIAALGFITGCKQAVDIGGHCGLWSKELIKIFDHVHAFEPMAAHRECFVENVPERYTLHPCALGEKAGHISLHSTEGSSGDTWINGEGQIPMLTLDSFNLSPDFIKLDCEGYEYFALKGGEETIKRCKPVIIVEQKPGNGQKYGVRETEAVTYLQSLGATLRGEMVGDFVLSWA